MNHLDLFSGIGAFTIAAESNGINTIGFCELDQNASTVLKKNYPNIHNYKDVRNLDGTVLRDFHGVDIVTGGFPCQDLSNALNGSHKDLDGEKSGLFYELARIVIETDPTWVIIENVPRVMKYLDVIKKEMHFHDWSADVFESGEYGALCRRKRAFIVGCSREGSAKQVLDLTKKHRQAISGRGDEDVFPMCLPWKGGVSLERLGSCVVESEEVDPTRIREGDGLPRRVDGHRYLMLGNSITPVIPTIIMNYINQQEKRK